MFDIGAMLKKYRDREREYENNLLEDINKHPILIKDVIVEKINGFVVTHNYQSEELAKEMFDKHYKNKVVC